MPTTILITGAHGFLARAVALQAPAAWRLVGLVRPGNGPRTQAGWHSLHDCVETLAVSEPQIDAVLHLAARIPSDMRQLDPGLVDANIALPAQLLLRYPDARHVLASSIAVYGNPASLPLSVNSTPAPSTAYGWSKLAAERLVGMAASHAVLRLSSIIGRGMRPGSFIPSVVAAAGTGRVTVYGDGSRTQDYIDVHDAARMCITATTRADNFHTLAVSGKAYSNLAVANELAALTNAAIECAGEDSNPSFEFTLRGAVDLGPCEIPLRDTLKHMVNG